mgnify:CR=1 FL=1
MLPMAVSAVLAHAKPASQQTNVKPVQLPGILPTQLVFVFPSVVMVLFLEVRPATQEMPSQLAALTAKSNGIILVQVSLQSAKPTLPILP